MRNFTAYAAREAVTFALLHPTPEDVADIRRHLMALGPDAPAARHLDIVEADAALEDANEAATTARKLTGVARNLAVAAADTQLRDAVRNAERLILAVEPTAARFRGTDMPVTPDAITAAAAVAYVGVRASAEELRAIAQGTPVVQVYEASNVPA
ncbi:hypothetical protein [Actinacidiphila oryziradicis]|uniref:Uncharacterized protein n=1 Tax=Actinacidiphila oryziradicis TaxID=2571141 RepID=A0A4U0RXT8_9ACTN|nr:hypothetical protein [Actinacidiphila oryziradicis]TJZ93164.1 hypothetical protein FCI23_54715 [Actinacidiphila oryziradicis]